MNKKEFENNKKPHVMIVSIHPVTHKAHFTYIEGYSENGFVAQFKKDFPTYFTFMRLNKSAVKLRAKEMFGLD